MRLRWFRVSRTPKRLNFQVAENSSCACERSLRLDFLSLLLILLFTTKPWLKYYHDFPATATAGGGACDMGHYHHKQVKSRNFFGSLQWGQRSEPKTVLHVPSCCFLIKATLQGTIFLIKATLQGTIRNIDFQRNTAFPHCFQLLYHHCCSKNFAANRLV